MSDFDPGGLEKEISKLRPAKPPQELLRRLSAAVPPAQRQRTLRVSGQRFGSWLPGIGWAAAATAAVLILIGLVHHRPLRTPEGDQAHLPVKSPNAPLKADNVEINRQLLTSFDAIAQLADGEPVRLRCREWQDAVVLRDSARGVVIERHAPRLEVIPVRLETY